MQKYTYHRPLAPAGLNKNNGAALLSLPSFKRIIFIRSDELGLLPLPLLLLLLLLKADAELALREVLEALDALRSVLVAGTLLEETNLRNPAAVGFKNNS